MATTLLATALNNYTPQIQWVLEQLDKTPVMKLAQATGINQRYLYAVKNSKYDEITPNVWQQISAASEADLDNAWVLAKTENFSTAVGVFHKAQTERLCLALTGETGFGKTQSAKQYRSRNTNVVYVHCNTEMTKLDFLTTIMRDLEIAPQHRGTNAHQNVKTIMAKMRDMKNPLLIIDDAGKLRDSAFRMFQLLFDESAGRVGFVLLGVPEFKTKVFANAKKGTFCYKEIARRIGWLSMVGIYQNDVAAICGKNGITDETAISYFVDNIGDFDTLRRMIRAAKTTADKLGVTVTRNFLAEKIGASVENYRVSEVIK